MACYCIDLLKGLCNVIYKIASKALVNRFQEVLRFCIDEAQSTFMLGYLISDNIVVAYEIFCSMKNRRLGKEGSFALKLDLSKAYDCVEWQFIKGLLALLRLAKSGGAIRGTRVVRGVPWVTHLLFVDNSLIFWDATKMGELNVLKVFQSYAKCSGWNHDLIDLLFVDDNAILIQGIPLPSVRHEDCLIWAHAMAQEGSNRDEDGFWVEEAPVLVEAAAAEDCRLHDPP
ncbi:uncharacterized protein [Gossypium hirsutum]|uniref:Reverse transcriptase n=1 Tax=Gossypium hirsutum TaxID=3635 RepID=A0A1U8J1I3_GOSHI|nr:uncharacterized protein LOC107902553 [Gossypium hirsutum]